MTHLHIDIFKLLALSLKDEFAQLPLAKSWPGIFCPRRHYCRQWEGLKRKCLLQFSRNCEISYILPEFREILRFVKVFAKIIQIWARTANFSIGGARFLRFYTNFRKNFRGNKYFCEHFSSNLPNLMASNYFHKNFPFVSPVKFCLFCNELKKSQQL